MLYYDLACGLSGLVIHTGDSCSAFTLLNLVYNGQPLK
jgi:hypothetical protein